MVWPRINIVDGLALRLRDISQLNVRSKHDEGLGWEFPRHGKVESNYLASSTASADLLDRRLKCQTLHKFTHAFRAIRRLWDVYTQFVAIRDQRGVKKYFIDSDNNSKFSPSGDQSRLMLVSELNAGFHALKPYCCLACFDSSISLVWTVLAKWMYGFFLSLKLLFLLCV